MTGSVIQLSMNFGYPGSYARMPDNIVIAKAVAADSAVIPFGSAVKLKADNTFALADGDLTADNFAGIAVREVRQQLVYQDDAQGAYSKDKPCDVLARGNTVIKLGFGTPTAGGKVLFAIAGNGVKASGTFTFADNMTSGKKITVGTKDLVAGTDFTLGANAKATIANIAALSVDGVTFTAADAVLTVTAAKAGTAGNSIAISTDDSEVTASGATLTGGVEETIAAGSFGAGSAVAGQSIALPNVFFTTGEKDANNVIEVSIVSRNNN